MGLESPSGTPRWRSSKPITRQSEWTGSESGQQADNDTKQRNTFNQGCSEDHTAADVASSFWLTGDAVHGSSGKLTDTDTGTDNSKACTKSGQARSVAGRLEPLR